MKRFSNWNLVFSVDIPLKTKIYKTKLKIDVSLYVKRMINPDFLISKCNGKYNKRKNVFHGFTFFFIVFHMTFEVFRYTMGIFISHEKFPY